MGHLANAQRVLGGSYSLPGVTAPDEVVLWPKGQGPRVTRRRGGSLAERAGSSPPDSSWQGGSPSLPAFGASSTRPQRYGSFGQGNMGHLANGWPALPFLYSSRIERYGGGFRR